MLGSDKTLKDKLFLYTRIVSQVINSEPVLNLRIQNIHHFFEPFIYFTDF